MKNANTTTMSPSGIGFSREIWKKRWEHAHELRKKSDEKFEAANQKFRQAKEMMHHSQVVLNDEISANEKKLKTVKPDEPGYLELLLQRKDLFEKLEQSFHKGSALRDEALDVMNDLYAEIHGYMTYKSHS